VLPASNSLVDLTEKYHLLSLLLFFLLVGIAHTLSMLIKTGFHLVRDVLEEYDDFREESRSHDLALKYEVRCRLG
jgi:hypothetical protein